MPFHRLLFIVLLLSSCSRPVKEDEHFLQNLMQTEPAKFQSVLDPQDSLEVQIIYTQINRDANNRPSFKSFYFNFHFIPGRVWKGEDAVEVEWSVGPIPIDDDLGACPPGYSGK